MLSVIILSVIMLSVIMLSVIMLSVIMLSVVILNVVAPKQKIPAPQKSLMTRREGSLPEPDRVRRRFEFRPQIRFRVGSQRRRHRRQVPRRSPPPSQLRGYQVRERSLGPI
jgi:hypothetical protein